MGKTVAGISAHTSHALQADMPVSGQKRLLSSMWLEDARNAPLCTGSSYVCSLEAFVCACSKPLRFERIPPHWVTHGDPKSSDCDVSLMMWWGPPAQFRVTRAACKSVREPKRMHIQSARLF